MESPAVLGEAERQQRLSDWAASSGVDLDSLLISMNQYAPDPPRFLFLCEKDEFKHIDDLVNQYRQYLGDYAALRFPVSPEQVKEALTG